MNWEKYLEVKRAIDKARELMNNVIENETDIEQAKQLIELESNLYGITADLSCIALEKREKINK